MTKATTNAATIQKDEAGKMIRIGDSIGFKSGGRDKSGHVTGVVGNKLEVKTPSVDGWDWELELVDPSQCLILG